MQAESESDPLPARPEPSVAAATDAVLAELTQAAEATKLAKAALSEADDA
jgi:hypothetical protein